MHLSPASWGRNGSFKLPLGLRQNLILLPPLLFEVCNDFVSANMLTSLLRIVHKYPLSEYHYSQPDGMSSLYEQVIAAAKKYLGPYSRVSVRFYTLRIPQIQIPNCRYAAYGMANMKKQKWSSHQHRPMSRICSSCAVQSQTWSCLEQIDNKILIYFFKQYLQLSSYHASGKKVIG